MSNLVASRYGKGRVRVFKILREGTVHRIKDINAAVFLEGDFASSFTAADNTKVVATDTIKNTVNVLAKDHLGDEIERFAIHLGQHFMRYDQVHQAIIDISERDWRRMDIDHKPHPHAFMAGSEAMLFTHVTWTRSNQVVQSGVRDMLILKSTGSGFEEYPKDEFTTLRETADRILGTAFTCTWTFEKLPANFQETNRRCLAAMLKVFAENYSPSVQTTLYQMAEAALAACPEISRLDLAMPNKHCLLIDLSPFGKENKNEVFVPIDEPHGQIEASVSR